MKKSNYIHATAKRLISIAVSAALCFCFSVSTFAGLAPSHGQSAYERSVTEPRGSLGNVSVYVDGVKYGGKAFLHKSVTYVGIREFSMHMGVSSVSWNGNAKTATVSSDSLSVSAKNSALYITANGRYLWAGSGIIIINGTMFVPLRTLCKAFGYNVLWNSNEFAAYITKGEALKSGNSYYDNDSIYGLSRIIHAEASGESLLRWQLARSFSTELQTRNSQTLFTALFLTEKTEFSSLP